MLQRIIYGVLHYGKDAVDLIGGGETLCYVAFLGTALAFLCFTLRAAIKRTRQKSADIACVLNKNLIVERAFREISKGLFFLSLIGVGIDAFTPPSPFVKAEILLGYLVLFFLVRQLLLLLLLGVLRAVNGRLAFSYRLARLGEEAKWKLRAQAERFTANAVEEENADLPAFVNGAGDMIPQTEEAPIKHQAEEGLEVERAVENLPPAVNPVSLPKEQEITPATCGISREGVLDLLDRAKGLPFSEMDALRYKKIELAVKDALSVEYPPKETVSSLLAALLKLYAKYSGAA